jgi:hypothetical protein
MKAVRCTQEKELHVSIQQETDVLKKREDIYYLQEESK